MSIVKIFKKACINGNIEEIKEIVYNIKKIDWRFVEIACEYGQFEIVKYLIEKEEIVYNIKKINLRFVEIACEYGQFEIVKYLIEKEEKNNRIINFNIRDIIFVSVCRNGFYNILIYLLNYCEKHSINIEVLVEDMLIAAIKEDHINIVKYIVEYCTQHKCILCIHNNNEYIFHRACTYRKVEIIKYLLEYCKVDGHPINIFNDNNNLFVYCVTNKFIDVVRCFIDYFIKYKININVDNYTRFIFDNLSNLTIDILKDIMKYYEIMNYKINVYIDTYGYSCRNDKYFLDMIRYLMYFYKHTYNLDGNTLYMIKDIFSIKNIIRIKMLNNKLLYEQYIYNNQIHTYYKKEYTGYINIYTINYCIYLN